MGRRSNPERVFAAWRAGIRSRLTGSGMDEATAERWCDAWEIEAASRGLSRDGDYWQTGADWIATERAAERPDGQRGPRQPQITEVP